MKAIWLKFSFNPGEIEPLLIPVLQSEDGSGNSGMKKKDSSDEEGCDCDQPAKEDVSEEYKSRSGSSSSNSPAPSPSVGAQWQHLCMKDITD